MIQRLCHCRSERIGTEQQQTVLGVRLKSPILYMTDTEREQFEEEKRSALAASRMVGWVMVFAVPIIMAALFFLIYYLATHP